MPFYAQLLNFHLCAGHPHIVQLLEVYATPTDLAIVMEFANGGAFPPLEQLTLPLRTLRPVGCTPF